MTPLGSKLITLGAGLACFEMRPTDLNAKYGVAIPHAEPRRYIASVEALRQSRPDISALLLTGEAYRQYQDSRPVRPNASHRPAFPHAPLEEASLVA